MFLQFLVGLIADLTLLNGKFDTLLLTEKRSPRFSDPDANAFWLM